MTKYMIVANPVSGSGAGARAIPRIEKSMREIGLDFDLVKTEYR